MAEKSNGREGIFDNIAEFSRSVLSPDSAKKFASWYIDASEKMANDVIDFQATATTWAKETPLAPVFEAQQEFGRKFVQKSAEAARKIWQLNS
jgi:hypothetical protein